MLRQIIGRGNQYHFERCGNRHGNHLFGYWFKIGFNFGYNTASAAIAGALIMWMISLRNVAVLLVEVF